VTFDINKSTIKALAAAISDAAASGAIRNSSSDILTGLSGNKLLGLLQRCPRLYDASEACYLEIGIFQGLSLLQVGSANPNMACFGIDNFSQFDPDLRNKSLVLERRQRLALRNVHLIDQDYEDALEQLEREIGTRRVAVYFIDGPHDYRSQLMCLALAMPFLHPRAVIIVDDSNYAHVRQANRDFLRTHPEFKLLFEAYTPSHPGALGGAELTKARDGWWNGINVIVRDPDNELPYSEPPTLRDRTRFLNDNAVHSARHAELAPEALNFVDALLSGRIHSAGWRLRELIRRRRSLRGLFRDRLPSRNTYSASLPVERFVGSDASEWTADA
jgi:hypothetical protein